MKKRKGMKMEMNRNTRKELDALSKNVFGTSSRWQKLIVKGYKELLTEDKEETIPPEKEGDEPTKKIVKTPVLNEFGMHRYIVKYHTIESIKEFLVEQKKQIDDLKEQIKKHQEELKAKKEADLQAKKLNEVNSGSAV